MSMTTSIVVEYGWVFVLHPPAGTVLLNMELCRCLRWFTTVDDCVQDAMLYSKQFNMLDMPTDCHPKIVLEARVAQPAVKTEEVAPTPVCETIAESPLEPNPDVAAKPDKATPPLNDSAYFSAAEKEASNDAPCTTAVDVMDATQ